MNHIFLTGERGVGKSTIISRITSGLDFVPKGFNTVVGDVSPDGNTDHIFIVPYGMSLTEKTDISPVAVRNRKERAFTAYPTVFDTLGVSILKDSCDARFIILDELGFMENDATDFKAEVLQLLDGENPILGVIKPRSTPFLDCARAHKNVTTIEVTVENREAVFKKLRTVLHEQYAL
ncbi:MAG: nucleoside-triphosphatase [Clostridiales Family XIII bacterium]|jgi:nucleoside-triphosphatase|nr:nucleoside-triphosphatase [Clostridiales Family XIII bacterium]